MQWECSLGRNDVSDVSDVDCVSGMVFRAPGDVVLVLLLGQMLLIMIDHNA